MNLKHKLQQAADQGIIHPEQVEPLFLFLNTSAVPSAELNAEEPLKFIRSFGDVFITLGVVLLVIAINMLALDGYTYLIPVAGFVIMAEWLVRVRRLALPGIGILLAILYFVNKAIHFDHEHATTLGIATLCVTSLLFYLRYRMPFSLLPLATGIVTIVVIQIGIDVMENPIIFVALGLVVFAIAMVFDALDPSRVTHLSDSAFWLHLLAAPLIVHGAMVSMLTSDLTWIQSMNKEILMIIFFSGFFLLALLVDRRALLISTQLYAIYALTQLLQEQLSSSQNIVMYVMIGLGLFVIFFGTYWYLARRLIWGFLAGSRVSRFLPDFSLRERGV